MVPEDGDSDTDDLNVNSTKTSLVHNVGGSGSYSLEFTTSAHSEQRATYLSKPDLLLLRRVDGSIGNNCGQN